MDARIKPYYSQLLVAAHMQNINVPTSVLLPLPPTPTSYPAWLQTKFHLLSAAVLLVHVPPKIYHTHPPIPHYPASASSVLSAPVPALVPVVVLVPVSVPVVVPVPASAAAP